MPAATEIASDIDRHLASLQRLTTPEDRRQFFSVHSHLIGRSTVDGLTASATALLRVDPRDAENLIETALWLADRLDDDFARGKAHRARANFSHVRGDEAQASAYYASAKKLFTSIGADLEAAITASSSLQTLVFQGQHDKAIEEAEFARGVFHRNGDRLRLARLNSNYANLHYHRDRWAEAARYYEAAYRDFLEVGEKQDVAVCLGNMAVCHLQQQDFVQALDFYRKTRAYCEQNGLTALTADLDYNIAYLHYLRGQYPTALELYREARTRHSELGDRHHVDLCALNEAEIYLELNLTSECVDLASLAYSGFRDRGLALQSAKALTILAIAESRQGKAFLALELLAQANRLFRRENLDAWVALVDLYRATLFTRAGRPFEARRLAAAASTVFERSSLLPKFVACQVLLARIALEAQSFDEARSHSTAALKALQQVDAPALHFQASFLLGDLERLAGNRDAALTAYLDAHARLGRTTGAIQTEEQRMQALDDKLVVYETLVELLAIAPPGSRDQVRAFAFMETAKSRSLTDLLAFRMYALPETQPGRSKLADQVRQLREELNWYYRQIDLQEMRAEDRSERDVEELRRYSRRQETRLIRTLNLLQQTDQDLSSVQEAFAAEPEAIRAALPPETTLIEYFISKGTVLAAVLNQEGLQIVPATLLSAVDELRLGLGAILSRDSTARADPATVVEQLQSLYGELLEPIIEAISGRCLVFVPHGSLFYIPFHALHDGARFLNERFSISYAPSATAYYLARRKPRRTTSRTATSIVLPENLEDLLGSLAHGLRESAQDAQIVREASLPGARQDLQRIVYFLTQPQVRQDNPMFSTLALGAESSHFFDLFRMTVEADLALIAGSSAGLQAKAKGDEVVGLVRGLFYAGARAVVTTLWDVSPETWKDFNSLMNEGLEEGHSIEGSVLYAVAAMRERGQGPHYWAPFTLFGDAHTHET